MSLFGKKMLRFEDLRTLRSLAEQVVLAIDQTLSTSGAEKKVLALKLLRELLQEAGLDPPLLLIDTAIEAAVRLYKLMDSQSVQ